MRVIILPRPAENCHRPARLSSARFTLSRRLTSDAQLFHALPQRAGLHARYFRNSARSGNVAFRKRQYPHDMFPLHVFHAQTFKT